jgi:hypothetical protein
MQRKLPTTSAPMSPKFEAMREKLPEGTTIVKRGEAVYLIEKLIKPTNAKGEQLGPDTSEIRIDSRQDRDMITKGEMPWYQKHLDALKSNKGNQQ